MQQSRHSRFPTSRGANERDTLALCDFHREVLQDGRVGLCRVRKGHVLQYEVASDRWAEYTLGFARPVSGKRHEPEEICRRLDTFGYLLSERHELAANRDREDDEVEYLNHLEIRVGAIGHEDSADVEQECFSEVDES